MFYYSFHKAPIRGIYSTLTCKLQTPLQNKSLKIKTPAQKCHIKNAKPKSKAKQADKHHHISSHHPSIHFHIPSSISTPKHKPIKQYLLIHPPTLYTSYSQYIISMSMICQPATVQDICNATQWKCVKARASALMPCYAMLLYCRVLLAPLCLFVCILVLLHAQTLFVLRLPMTGFCAYATTSLKLLFQASHSSRSFRSCHILSPLFPATMFS